MRNYSLTTVKNHNTWISWSQQFLHPLANDIKSLYDYWLYFSPNFEEIPYFNIINNENEVIKNGLKNLSDAQESNTINNKKLWINALNYRQYIYIKENNIKAAFGNDIDLPAGCLIISNVMPTKNNDSENEERKKIENYIIQYSSSADYYLYSIKRDDITNKYHLIATYTPNAGELYGNQITLQIPSYFPRFFMTPKRWQKGASGITFSAFNQNSDGTIIKQIVDRKGLTWQTFLEILPDIYLEKIDTVIYPNGSQGSHLKREEIILDASYSSYLNKIDNAAIPSYNITMNDNKNIKLINPLWISVY